MPLTTTQPTITISRVPAATSDQPSPSTRKGKPHSIAKTVPANWVEKCDHMPSRVPGFPHTVRTACASARSLITATSSVR